MGQTLAAGRAAGGRGGSCERAAEGSRRAGSVGYPDQFRVSVLGVTLYYSFTGRDVVGTLGNGSVGSPSVIFVFFSPLYCFWQLHVNLLLSQSKKNVTKKKRRGFPSCPRKAQLLLRVCTRDGVSGWAQPRLVAAASEQLWPVPGEGSAVPCPV